MDVIDFAILLLRIAIVAALYLFLVLVLRASVSALRPRPTPPRRLVLVVRDPGDSALSVAQRLDVERSTIIGRASTADLVLADAAVSAQHARVDLSDDGWIVTDLGSTNGTRVNARALRAPATLRAGDVLEVGPVRFDVSDT